jgi:cytoskeletal protein CcmA (bactofilin family)
MSANGRMIPSVMTPVTMPTATDTATMPPATMATVRSETRARTSAGRRRCLWRRPVGGSSGASTTAKVPSGGCALVDARGAPPGDSVACLDDEHARSRLRDPARRAQARVPGADDAHVRVHGPDATGTVHVFGRCAAYRGFGTLDPLTIEVGTVMRFFRILAATAVASVFVVFAALPAAAQTGGGGTGVGDDHSRRINITGGLVVAGGETVSGPAVSADGNARIDGRVNGAVYVGRGDLFVDGRVTGDALVLDGDAVISGRVDGDVTVINGKASVRSGADVRGDVTSRTTPTAARGTVQGHVKKFDLESAFTGFLVVILALLWVAVTLSIAILGFLFVTLFPRAADAAVVAGRRVWVSLFWGVVIGILGPILGIVIMTSIVGIPLGAAMLGTVAVLGPLGYVAGALSFGRLLVKGSTTGGRIGAFFAGFGILRFAALVPGIGFLVGFVFATYGIGALTIAGWRAAHLMHVGAPGTPPAPALAAAGAPPPAPSDAPTVPIVAAAASSPRKARARKATAKKTTAKKTTKKKAPAKKKAAAKKKATSKKKAPAKTTAKRAPAKKKTPTRKSPAKTTTKKTAAKKKAPAKKTAPKRTTTKSTTAKRPAKRTSTAKRRTTAAKTGPAKRSPTTRRRATRSPARKGPRPGR